jgi:hypothetical protein
LTHEHGVTEIVDHGPENEDDYKGLWMTVKARCPRCRKAWIGVAPNICTRLKCPRDGCPGWAKLAA